MHWEAWGNLARSADSTQTMHSIPGGINIAFNTQLVSASFRRLYIECLPVGPFGDDQVVSYTE